MASEAVPDSWEDGAADNAAADDDDTVEEGVGGAPPQEVNVMQHLPPDVAASWSESDPLVLLIDFTELSRGAIECAADEEDAPNPFEPTDKEAKNRFEAAILKGDFDKNCESAPSSPDRSSDVDSFLV